MLQPIIWSLRGRPSSLIVAISALKPPAQQKPDDVQAPRLAPILFYMAERRAHSGLQLGMGPSLQGRIPLPAARVILSGSTKNASGVGIGGCTVKIFRTADNAYIGSTVSDASGNYEYALPAGSSVEQYFSVAYLAGAPDVAGTTLNNLTGTST